MDGGELQAKMATEVKAEVKQAAQKRRELHGPGGRASLPRGSVAASPTTLAALSSAGRQRNSEPGLAMAGLQATTPVAAAAPSSSSSSSAPPSSAETFLGVSPTASLQVRGRDEIDLSFVMFYIDKVFPLLFPFYSPSLLDGGRGWLLVQILKNPTLLHTTLCLSLFFFSSIIQEQSRDTEATCNILTREELGRSIENAFGTLQRDFQLLDGPVDSPSLPLSNTDENALVAKSRLLGNVVQLLHFEIGTGCSVNSVPHLEAAIALFEGIFHDYGLEMDEAGNARPSLSLILGRMARPPWSLSRLNGEAPRNADQAAFRFFSAVLLVDDIVISTALARSPRLQEHHRPLLGPSARDANMGMDDAGDGALDPAGIIGCCAWVLLLVGEIAGLDAWKKDQQKHGRLDMMQLCRRADTIEQALHKGIEELSLLGITPEANGSGSNVMSPSIRFWQQSAVPPENSRAKITAIWAHAALIFLSVVVSGWQPFSHCTAHAVGCVLELLGQVDATENVAVLRTLAWPFCIAGCLAQPAQFGYVKALVKDLGPLGSFSSLRLAMDVVEQAWSRSAPDANGISVGLDLTACLNSLGYAVLLV